MGDTLKGMTPSKFVGLTIGAALAHLAKGFFWGAGFMIAVNWYFNWEPLRNFVLSLIGD